MDELTPPRVLGLHKKYVISKADGSPIEPDAQYFVLRCDTDEIARVLLRAYAEAMRETKPVLWVDLLLWLDQMEEG